MIPPNPTSLTFEVTGNSDEGLYATFVITGETEIGTLRITHYMGLEEAMKFAAKVQMEIKPWIRRGFV